MASWNLENPHKFCHDRVLGGVGLVIFCDAKAEHACCRRIDKH